MSLEIINLLGFGQSNMVARERFGSGRRDNGAMEENPDVLVWNSNTGAFEAVQTQSITQADGTTYKVVTNGFHMSDGLSYANNMVWSLAKRINEETGAQINVVIDGHGGEGIDSWSNSNINVPNSEYRYDDLTSKIDDSDVDEFDFVVFAQGESNYNGASSSNTGVNSKSEYEDAMDILLTKLYAEDFISSNTVFAMPELYEANSIGQSSDRNDVIDGLDSDGDARTVTGQIYGALLNYSLAAIGESGDDVHWTGESLEEIGQTILWESYLKGLAQNEHSSVVLNQGTVNDDNINTVSSNTNDHVTVVSGDGNDTIATRYGDDRIYAGNGDDSVVTSKGKDLIMLGNGNDIAYAGSDDDVVSGDAGNDKIYGQDGDDILFGGEGSDYVYGQNGEDKIYGGLGRDYLYGGSDNDVISGGAYHDKLYGGGAHDKLYGGSGADKLYGGSGHDLLEGGAGADTLVGGSGSDKFIFLEDDAFSGVDTIADFDASQNDKIDISDVLINYGLGDDIGDFVSLEVNGTDTLLKIDVDGASNGTSFVTVTRISDIDDLDLLSMISAGELII